GAECRAVVRRVHPAGPRARPARRVDRHALLHRADVPREIPRRHLHRRARLVESFDPDRLPGLLREDREGAGHVLRALRLGLAEGQHVLRAPGRRARDARRRAARVRRQGRTHLPHQLRRQRLIPSFIGAPRPAGPQPRDGLRRAPPPEGRPRYNRRRPLWTGRVPMDARTTNTVQTADRVSAFLWKVYGWMAVGLGLTAIVAFAVAGSPDLLRVLVGNRLVFFALVIAELGLVFFMSARADRLSPGTASGLFALYSALNGVTLSVILLAYTGESVTMTFVVTAGMFGALAPFCSTTKRSLAGAGQFFMMGLIGLILASIVGMFWHNDALQFLISVVGVIVFTGLTAWDAQRLKQMAVALPEGQVGAYAVVGALSLYLNFINLFLMLLRFTGSRRD